MLSKETQYNTIHGLDEYVGWLQRRLYNMKYCSPYFWIGQCTQNCTDIQEKNLLFSFISLFFVLFVCFFFLYLRSFCKIFWTMMFNFKSVLLIYKIFYDPVYEVHIED